MPGCLARLIAPSERYPALGAACCNLLFAVLACLRLHSSMQYSIVASTVLLRAAMAPRAQSWTVQVDKVSARCR